MRARPEFWFHRTFGRDPSFVAGPFQPPPAPEDAAAPVRAELERLRADLLATKSAAVQARAGIKRKAIGHSNVRSYSGIRVVKVEQAQPEQSSFYRDD